MFLFAYVRVNQPFLGGADLETMDKIFAEVVSVVGDNTFSDAVREQRAEIQSAVKYFIGPDKDRPLTNFPKTAALLRKALKIDWPLDKAIRED